MTTKSSLPGKQTDPMGAAKCMQCDDTIEAGEHRVVMMMVEMNRDGRGNSCAFAYCDKCIAETPTIEIENPWKMLSDSLADPSAGRGSEDFMLRTRSLEGMAADEAERNADGGDETSVSDIEAALNSTDTRDTLWPESATEDDLRDRMSAFLETQESRKISKTVRIAADKWASGETQGEIARAMSVNQATISRWLAEAKTWLYKKPDSKRAPGHH